MRHRGCVHDPEDLQTGGLQGTNGRLTAGAGALDEDINLAHPVILSLLAGGFCSKLRSKRSGLAGAFETDIAGGRP